MSSSLIQLFENRGVDLATRREQIVALGLSQTDTVRDALSAGCLLAWHGTRLRIDVTGRHRDRFIHNMTTCQIKSLEPGTGNFGMVVNDGGKLVAQFHVECAEDRLVLDVAPDEADGMIAQLKKYIIADDVKFAEPQDTDLLTLVGANADALMERAGIECANVSEQGWIDGSIAEKPCRVRRNSLRLGVSGWDVIVNHQDAADIWTTLEGLGAVPAGFDAWERCRIDYGWPITGIDFGDENIPLEADRLAATIDWDKGCYIGQEVIAMMHYRGRPNKHLGKITFATLPEGYEPGLTLTLASGKTAGRLGSIIEQADGGVVGLAVVKRRHADDGATLMAPCGTEGTFHRFPKYEVD